jgi:type 1 glutamine amidotransferase
MNKISLFLFFALMAVEVCAQSPERDGPIRVMVITGNHAFNKDAFHEMMESLGDNITYDLAELPQAYDYFLLQNREKYDVLLFYHMYQEIDGEQKRNLTECLRNGKPLIALHHSICAYDNWPEYYKILGGKYFQSESRPEGGKMEPGSGYTGKKFIVKISNPNHPVTKGIKDFEITDETYKGYYVEDGVTPLLTTIEPTSTPVIGWTKKYGKARVITLQSGHDAPAYGNESFRKILKQAIEWATEAPPVPVVPEEEL